jgi:hypothetical protein
MGRADDAFHVPRTFLHLTVRMIDITGTNVPLQATNVNIGTLTVTGDGKAVSLPLTLHVWDFEMPAKQHVSVINWGNLPQTKYDGKPYEKGYWEALITDLKFLVANGQTDVQHPGFALLKKKDNGEWDTALFERWTETALASGMRQFHLHGLGQGRTLSHLAYTSEVQPLNQSNLEKLPVIESVMKRRGWEGKFVVSICDEPFIMNEISYMERVREIRKTAPGIRILEAMEAEYLGDVDVYCPKLNHLKMWNSRFRELQDAGKEMWYYICLHPTGRYPNRFGLAHLKDMAKGTPLGVLGPVGATSVALGTGIVDWSAILKAANKSAVKVYYIEDESPAASTQVPISLGYLQSLGMWRR